MEMDKVTKKLSDKMELENVGNIEAHEVWNEETEKTAQHEKTMDMEKVTEKINMY